MPDFDRPRGEEPEDRGGLAWAKWNAPPKSPEERQRDLEESREFHRRRMQAGARASRTRIIDVGPEPGSHTVQTRHRDGELSAVEVVDEETIATASRRTPRWPEMESYVRAILTSLRRTWRQAHLRVVPGGPQKRKRGHRQTAVVVRDGEQDDERHRAGTGRSPYEAIARLADRVDVLTMAVAMLMRQSFLPVNGASSHRSDKVSDGAGKSAPLAKPATAPRRRRGGRRYNGEVVAAVVCRAIDLDARPSQAIRDHWHAEIAGSTTPLIKHVHDLMGNGPLPPARRERWKQEASRMNRDDSITLVELTRRLGEPSP
jgi:hypothetical protein